MAAPGTPSPDAPDQAAAWAVWLLGALKARAMNEHQFARAAGLKTTTVNRWTNGESPPRSADTVIAVAHFLAPDQTADALDAAGFPRTAEVVRQGRTGDGEGTVMERAQREHEAGRITRSDMDRIIGHYQRRRAENTRLFEAEVADLVRERRRERRERITGRDDENGRAAL